MPSFEDFGSKQEFFEYLESFNDDQELYEYLCELSATVDSAECLRNSSFKFITEHAKETYQRFLDGKITFEEFNAYVKELGVQNVIDMT